MLNRRLLVYTSGRVTNQPPEGLIITVIDYDTKQPVANAHVDIRDASGIMHISLGITSSSGVLAVSGLTLPPGDYIISVGAFGYEIKEYPYIVTSEAPISFLLVLVSQIFLTTVIVCYDHMEKYEAQLLIFAAQCCFIWYQIAVFESASRKK